MITSLDRLVNRTTYNIANGPRADIYMHNGLACFNEPALSYPARISWTQTNRKLTKATKNGNIWKQNKQTHTSPGTLPSCWKRIHFERLLEDARRQRPNCVKGPHGNPALDRLTETRCCDETIVGNQVVSSTICVLELSIVARFIPVTATAPFTFQFDFWFLVER